MYSGVSEGDSRYRWWDMTAENDQILSPELGAVSSRSTWLQSQSASNPDKQRQGLNKQSDVSLVPRSSLSLTRPWYYRVSRVHLIACTAYLVRMRR